MRVRNYGLQAVNTKSKGHFDTITLIGLDSTEIDINQTVESVFLVGSEHLHYGSIVSDANAVGEIISQNETMLV